MTNWQRDPRWGNIKLGFSDTYIRDYGCTVSVIGNILNITPDVVNEKLKSVNGFAYGNLVIWAKIAEAFPGVTVNRVWTYNNDDVKANVPNVIVEVPAKAIGGTGKHWVQFIGNHICRDPWTGQERPVSDFLQYGDPTGYCIIKGVVVPPVPPSDYDLEQKIRQILGTGIDPRLHIAQIRDLLK